MTDALINTDAAIEPGARIESLIEITEALSGIFSEENYLLENKRPSDIAPLQAEKARLAAAYAQAIRDIAANRTVFNTTDNRLLIELRSITQTFEERAAAQRALLEGASKAAEGIVKAVAEEAGKQSAPPAYGDASDKAAPISVNENA